MQNNTSTAAADGRMAQMLMASYQIDNQALDFPCLELLDPSVQQILGPECAWIHCCRKDPSQLKGISTSRLPAYKATTLHCIFLPSGLNASPAEPAYLGAGRSKSTRNSKKDARLIAKKLFQLHLGVRIALVKGGVWQRITSLHSSRIELFTQCVSVGRKQ